MTGRRKDWDDPNVGPPMTRAEFHAWLDQQPERWERIDGRPVLMGRERLGHARAKKLILKQLDGQIDARGLPCEAYPDGMMVPVEADTDLGPDVMVACDGPHDPAVTAIEHPVIVVEVLSPGTWRTDVEMKLMYYFRVPSVRHYVIVQIEKVAVIHHVRDVAGQILTHVRRNGTLDLDPPGLTLDLDTLFRDLDRLAGRCAQSG